MNQNPWDAPPGSPYCGMTINERLFAAGLLYKWDMAVTRRDRAAMIGLLVATDLPLVSAERTTDAILTAQK